MRLAVVFLIAIYAGVSDGFLVAPPPSRAAPVAQSELFMAKKRRKRKSSPAAPDEQPQEISADNLPEFDLDDGSVQEAKAVEPVKRAVPVGDVSVDDLLSDRGLEQKMQFDEPEMDLPDLADFSTSSAQQPAAMGKKRARAVERRAAAIAKKQEEEAEGAGFLSNLPFGGGGEEGENNISIVKIIEYGTWVGIFLLVAWEVYINSPFFERAAPMAPVVY